MNTIFNIETKEDSPERLEAVANKPHNNILFANEFNATVKEAAQSAIDNMSLDFSWAKREGWYKNNTEGFKRIYLLNVKIYESWILDEADKVELLIDRYRPKRTIRKLEGKFNPSGFKHRIYPDTGDPKRPSVIELTLRETILDFGQEFYFKLNQDNQPWLIKAVGYGMKNRRGNRAWVMFRFRLKVTVGDKVYYSKPKGIVEMVAEYNKTLSGGDEYRISYKLKN